MPALRRTPFALVAALAFPLTATSAEKDTATVEGRVTFEGKPVIQGKMSFHPAKGKPVVANIKDGSYAVKAMPTGNFAVTFEAKGLPRLYAAKGTTPIRLTIKGGEQTVDFVLTKK
jgi:hypothetical protein